MQCVGLAGAIIFEYGCTGDLLSMASNASVYSGLHTNGALFLLSSPKLSPSSVNLWEYLFKQLAIPKKRKDWSPLTWVGCGILLMPCSLSSSGLWPSGVKVLQKKLTCLVLSCSLSEFNFRLCYLVTCKNLVKYSFWSPPSVSSSHIIISSAIPQQMSRLLKIVSSLHWNASLLQASKMASLWIWICQMEY